MVAINPAVGSVDEFLVEKLISVTDVGALEISKQERGESSGISFIST